MIRIKGISKSIGKKSVINELSFSILPGKITAICGPNGAGKTTIIRLILKLLKPDRGSIEYNMDFNRISFLLHNNCLYPDLSLLDNFRFFQSTKGLKLDYDLLNYFLCEFSLTDEIKSKVATLSQGMQKKANIIRTLIEEPLLLVLDEPTSDLDPVGRIEIRKILKNLVRKNGLTIFYSSHILSEMEKMADKVLVVNQGHIVWKGDSNYEKFGKKEDLESKFIRILGIDLSESQ